MHELQQQPADNGARLRSVKHFTLPNRSQRLSRGRRRLLEINEADASTPFLRSLDAYCGASCPRSTCSPCRSQRVPSTSCVIPIRLSTSPAQWTRYASATACLQKAACSRTRYRSSSDGLGDTARGCPPAGSAPRTPERDDLLVRTEHGTDAWLQPIEAGFDACSIVSVGRPAAHALYAVREH